MNIKIDPEKAAMYIKWMSLGYVEHTSCSVKKVIVILEDKIWQNFNCSYGIVSFALVFLVEQLGGILQATLTLNGLIGGVTLGLFSLGVLFKCANSKGALYGGIVSLVLVVYIGIMAQINEVIPTPLSSSLTQCDCYTNETGPIRQEVELSKWVLSAYIYCRPIPWLLTFSDYNYASYFCRVSPLFRISYIWYSFLGAVLTVLFGLIISFVTDRISASQILHLTANNRSQSIEQTDEKCERKLSECAKNSPAIFIVEKYRKTSQMNQNLRGIDNMGMKMEEV